MTPDLGDWLERSGAYHDLVTWAGARSQGRLGWQEAWGRCPRGDWLLAIGARIGIPEARLGAAALACLDAALLELPAGDRGVLESALEAARANAEHLPRRVNRLEAELFDPRQLTWLTALEIWGAAQQAPEHYPGVVLAWTQLAAFSPGDPMEAMARVQGASATLVRDVIDWELVAAHLPEG